jgi:hypothetical protein
MLVSDEVAAGVATQGMAEKVSADMAGFVLSA